PGDPPHPSCPTRRSSDLVPEIVARLEDAGVNVPIIGDFHYHGHLLLTKYPECARALAKYRINPGNVGAKRRDENFRTIVQCAIGDRKSTRRISSHVKSSS